MKSMKRKALAFGTGIAAAVLVAVAGGPTPCQAAAVKTLQLGYIMAEGDPADLGAKRFKEIVEKETNGAVKVVIHANGLLGGERSLWESMQIGSADIAITGVGPISFFTPIYGGVQMYYAIEDVDHLEAVFNGPIGEEIRQALLKAKGGLILDWWHRGARQVTAKKAIRTPEDLKGLKLRTPEGRIYLEAWKALGASPTPMAMGEVFTGLQQGVVDGQENPLEFILTQSLNEVQTHVSLTAHQITPYLVAMREQTLKSLTPEQQKIVREAMLNAGVYEKKIVAEGEEKYKKDLAAKGMTIVEDVDRAAFKRIMHETALKLEQENLWQKGLYDRIQAARKPR